MFAAVGIFFLFGSKYDHDLILALIKTMETVLGIYWYICGFLTYRLRTNENNGSRKFVMFILLDIDRYRE